MSDFSIFENDADYISKLYEQAHDDVPKQNNTWFDSLENDASNPKGVIFKFENLARRVTVRNDDIDTGITRNQQTSNLDNSKGSNQDKLSSIVNLDHGEPSEVRPQNSIKQPNVDMSEYLNTKSAAPEFHKPKVRRDVVNKTIFRIIRRYFHSVLVKLIPDYKKQKKHNLMNMLISFSEYLFPQVSNSLELAQVLSALMFRREVLTSKMDKDVRMKVQPFLDIQSKYTHKLISQVMTNMYFRVIFKYFLDTGLSFFYSDENVKSHQDQYSQELDKIKEVFSTTS